MKEERVKQFVGKTVKIFLKNILRHYTAEILCVIDGTAEIKDKFGKVIPIDCDMIGLMEEMNDGRKKDGDDTNDNKSS